MAQAGYRLRLDPWATEYERSIELAEGEDELAETDTAVERDTWEAVWPVAPPPARAVFVDGVRRIDHRLLIEDGERTVFGLLGGFAVGAADVTTVARVTQSCVCRIACAGGGLLLAPFAATLANGRQTIGFSPEAVPENTPQAPLQGLQNAMRRREAELGRTLAQQTDVVFLDGPLGLPDAAAGPIVGVVKRLVRSYLPAAQASLLKVLSVGQRTPLFLIKGERHQRYSWYARIANGRAIESPLTGVVRLETSGLQGLARARALADTATGYLPRFASDTARDPRAPQNLYPIGALEAQLRHLLGDPLVIRRAIEARLHAQAVS